MRLFLALLLILASGAHAVDSVRPMVPASGGGLVVRNDQYQYLITDEDVGWDQLEQVRSSGDWQVPEVDTLNVVNPGTLWIKIPVAAPSEEKGEWRLEVRWPHLRSVDMAVWHPGQGLGQIHRGGQRVPLSELEFAHKNIVFPVILAPGAPATLYFRIAERGAVYFPMMLFSKEDYESHNTTRLVLFSMAFGIMGVMILYNLSLYFAVRERMYLFYTNAVFSCLFYALAVSGYGRLAFWAGNSWMETHASLLFAAYSFLSVTYFFRIFLDLPRYGGWALKANTFFLLCFVAALVIASTPYVAYSRPLLGMVSGPSGIVAFVTAIWIWRGGNPSAKYFILAWTGVMISTTLIVLTLRGQIDYFPALEYTQTASFVAEVVLLSLALADRIRRQRIEKEQAQAALLQMQQQANSKLEAQVLLRTKELEAAMVDLQNANRELSDLTKVDPLTQVSNRRHFDQVGEVELARAQRANRPLSVIMVDIDRFKAINDSNGHIVGDKCLKLVAKCISQQAGRVADVVARFGGEEFALILPETDEAAACILADRIRSAVEQVTLIYEGKTIRMTVSLGVCGRVPQQQESFTKLVEDADKALYWAKEHGRNQVADTAHCA